jgi:hypothetical protein
MLIAGGKLILLGVVAKYISLIFCELIKQRLGHVTK